MRPIIALIALVWLEAVAPHARQEAIEPLTRSEHMIAMRDGVRLYTQVYVPARIGGVPNTRTLRGGVPVSEALPIIFQRTPYGIGQNTAEGVAAALSDLLVDGYIIVLQDI